VPPKAKNHLLAVLAASTALSGFIAWKQTARLSALENDLLKASAIPVSTKPPAAPPAIADTAAEPPAKTLAAAPTVEPPSPPPEESAPSTRPRNGGSPDFTALMANPEFAKAVNLQQRSALDARYADLFKQLNLPPAALDKLKDLLVERQAARTDVLASARAQGLSPRENREELLQMVADAQAEVDANIKASLGEGVFLQYQNYEATQPQRTVVAQLDQRLSYTASPLTPGQAEFLVRSMATTTNRAAAPEVPPAGVSGNWAGGGNRAPITDDLIQQARSVLTADQVAALKQLQAEQQARQQVREMMRNGGAPDRPPRN
jgi:hypothetical protein